MRDGRKKSKMFNFFAYSRRRALECSFMQVYATALLYTISTQQDTTLQQFHLRQTNGGHSVVYFRVCTCVNFHSISCFLIGTYAHGKQPYTTECLFCAVDTGRYPVPMHRLRNHMLS